MSACFVISTEGSPERAVFEFSNSFVSVIANRNVRFPAATELEAESQVRINAPTFLSVPINHMKIEKITLDVGHYFRSIARPTYPGTREAVTNVEFNEEREFVARVKREIHILWQDLEDCFDVSSPYPQNLNVFGTWYESTILFASIGIENLFKKALIDNGLVKKTFNMTDFVKLKPLLKLEQYEVTLARYPWLKPFKPFLHWDSEKPAQSLAWFDAYNALKHDKELSYMRATMENAINSCLGYWILLNAVFGHAVDTRAFQTGDEGFYINARPFWKLNECYIKSADDHWTVVKAPILNL